MFDVTSLVDKNDWKDGENDSSGDVGGVVCAYNFYIECNVISHR